VLTVRLLAYTGKAVTLYNALETFTFCGAYHINFFAFGKNVNRDGVANAFF